MTSPLLRRRWELRAVLAVLASAGVGFAPVSVVSDEAKNVPVVAVLDDERDEKLTVLMGQARRAFAAGDTAKALSLADEATLLAPDEAQPYALRASLYTAMRKHQESLADYDRLVGFKPHDANARDARGAAKFCSGKFTEAVADFDKAVELDPARANAHWRRGIAYYFAGKFEEGRQQFEGYQTVDDSDVENAVWRFLCMARKEGFDEARARILKIGDDRRVPMRAIYDLFAGRGTVDDVYAACKSGDPTPRETNDRLFYAEQYLGLYAEARGDAQGARVHMQRAVEHKISHYMYDVAVVHLARLAAPANAATQE